MEPIYLCRDESKFVEWYASHATHVALPRAEYDALVARTEKPLDHVMRTSCGHEWTVRHTSCPTCFAALRAERDSLVRERDEAAAHEENAANETAELAQMIYGTASKMGVLHPDASTGAALRSMHNAYDAATARAEKAEALLREARVWVHDGVMGRFTPRSCAETVMARIDAHLDGGA